MELFILAFQFPSEELFTTNSLTTLVGLTGMVYVASNSMQRAFNFNPKWLALAIAQVLSLLAVYIAYKNKANDLVNYIIGVFNGFLVYLTSAGATGVGDSNRRATDKEGLYNLESNTRRKFSSSWW